VVAITRLLGGGGGVGQAASGVEARRGWRRASVLEVVMCGRAEAEHQRGWASGLRSE
jgi:hypothetical protein